MLAQEQKLQEKPQEGAQTHARAHIHAHTQFQVLSNLAQAWLGWSIGGRGGGGGGDAQPQNNTTSAHLFRPKRDTLMILHILYKKRTPFRHWVKGFFFDFLTLNMRQ